MDGELYTVVEFLHVKPGKGAAFVRTKLKNLETGAVFERNFRAGERVNRAHIETKEMQYLYSSGDEYFFMDTSHVRADLAQPGSPRATRSFSSRTT